MSDKDAVPLVALTEQQLNSYIDTCYHIAGGHKAKFLTLVKQQTGRDADDEAVAWFLKNWVFES